MLRLYDAVYDEERWKVELINAKNYKTYKIIDKENLEIYYFNNIIGFEQVADDEFLVYKRANYNNFAIIRYRLENSEKQKIIYNKEFSQFQFITDDRILFTHYGNDGNYYFQGVYSIDKNKEVAEANWLEHKGIEFLDNDTNNILVTKEIYFGDLGKNELLFVVDGNTLEPVSDCYSTLRNNYIKINSKEDYKILEKEEKTYAQLISYYNFNEYMNNMKEAKKRILEKNK